MIKSDNNFNKKNENQAALIKLLSYSNNNHYYKTVKNIKINLQNIFLKLQLYITRNLFDYSKKILFFTHCIFLI